MFSGILDQGCARYVVRARGAGRWSLRVLCGKRKKKFWNLSRELGGLDSVAPPRLCWTPVDARDHAGAATLGAVLDAGGRSGPRWTGDAWLPATLGSHGWLRYSTARRDRAHNLKEAEGRAWTVRSNQRSSNALYCRVNERMNNEMRRDSCSSSLINFVLNLSKLFLMNCRMSSS